MPPRDWKMRIGDILDSVEAICEFTAGMSYETFSGDRKTVDAVIRNITIIGEAARNVPTDVTDRYSDIPWERYARYAKCRCSCLLRDTKAHFMGYHPRRSSTTGQPLGKTP